MGADITHGVALEKKSEGVNGDLVVEIVPVTGGYYGPSYSTVEAAVAYAQSIGVTPDLWPIYYGVPDSEIDIAEVYDRCNRLKQCLLALPADAVSGNSLLKRVADWLHAGERFLITE